MARWIAATPLYNGSTLKGDNRNYASEYQRYDPAAGTLAAAAAKAVIDFTTNTGENAIRSTREPIRATRRTSAT